MTRGLDGIGERPYNILAVKLQIHSICTPGGPMSFDVIDGLSELTFNVLGQSTTSDSHGVTM
jgi:hypothetical protein